MAIPEFDSMLAFCSKCAKQNRKWLSQRITDVQPRDDLAALPTMARYTTMNHLFEGHQRLPKVYPRHARLWDMPFVVISEVSSPAVPHETQT